MKAKLLTLLVGAGIVIGLGSIWRSQSGQIRHWLDIAPVGETFEGRIEIASAQGERADLGRLLKNKWTLLTFVGMPYLLDGEFVQALARRHAPHLQVINVTSSSLGSPEQNDSAETPASMWIDVDRKLQEHFQVPANLLDRASWTLLVKPDGIVDFSFPSVLKNSDLRSLVESRLAPMNVFPSEKATDVIRPGARLPPLRMTKVEGEGAVQLDGRLGRPSTLLYLPASSCSACSLGSLEHQLRQVEAHLREQSDELPFFVVLSHFVRQSDALALLGGLKDSAYQLSEESSLLLEDPYYSLSDEDREPFFLEVTSDWIVREQVPLGQWLALRKAE